MSAASAVAFLWTRSVRNWGRAQVKRLKNPRYLVAAAAGVFYFYTIFLRRLSRGPYESGEHPSPGAMALIEAGITVSAVLAVVTTWIFGGSRGLLTFTEAEVQYLFPAPLTRRSILHVRVLKTLLRTALSAAIMTLLFRRAWGANPAALALGTWMAFASLSLHSAGISLLRESLTQHRSAGWKRWWVALLVVLGAVGAVVSWALSVHRPPWPHDLTAEDLRPWVALLDSPPLSYVLWPLRAPIRVALADDWGALLRRLPAALAVLGALYAWVISSGVAFEEAAVEAASERARRLELRKKARAGLRFPKKVKSSRLPLPRRGPSWIALTWKNLIAARRTAATALLAGALGVVVAMVVIARDARNGDEPFLPLLIASGAAGMAGFLALFGPIWVTADLRQDMPMSDVLRTLPLKGWQVVMGEVLASGLLLAAAQWGLWLIAALVAWSQETPGLEPSWRVPVVLGAMVFGPALGFAGLCVQNAGAIFFPAWVTVAGRMETRGFEATGQRLLTLVGTMLVLTVALIPAALVGGVAGYAAYLVIGPWGVVVGALFGAGVLLAECLLVIRGLGVVFERIDLTE
ncbi:MAG TPA: putative ABC exporter domain-containing protein [Myxococcaceae bacterium]